MTRRMKVAWSPKWAPTLLAAALTSAQGRGVVPLGRRQYAMTHPEDRSDPGTSRSSISRGVQRLLERLLLARCARLDHCVVDAKFRGGVQIEER